MKIYSRLLSIGLISAYLATISLADSIDTNTTKKDGGGIIGGFFDKIFKEPSLDEVMSTSQDKDLSKAFYDKKLGAKFYGGSILIQQKLIKSFDDGARYSNVKDKYAAMDSLEDDIANTYREVVTTRGNTYKVFKGPVNQRLQESLTNGKGLKKVEYSTYFYYDMDYAIIEYDKNNRMKSFLARVAIIDIDELGIRMGMSDPKATAARASLVCFNTDAKLAEQKLSNSFLQDNFFSSSAKSTPQAEQVSSSQSSSSNTAKIKELFELYKAGALTKEEFESQKKKLLETPQSVSQSQPTQEVPKNGGMPANGLEDMMVAKYNAKHGTNYKSMKEIMSSQSK